MTTKSPDAAEGFPVTAWSPFRYRVFVVIWTASLVSAVGTWMRDVGAGWLMTSLSTSVAQVALVQVATTLPIFALSLPAGALADIVDRRKVLLCMNVVLAAVAAVMTFLTADGRMTPELLVGCLFVSGICTALMQPMQQSLTPLMVPKEHLRSAIALNSLGFNLARAIGPALAGVIIAGAGVAFSFAVDTVSYLAVLGAYFWWRGASKPASEGVPESLGPAMRAGLRYAMHSGTLKRTLMRSAAFFIFASAFWALLPVVVRKLLGGGPGYYGLLLGCVGAGGVAGAVLLPKVRERIGPEGVVRAGTVVAVLALAVLAAVRSQELAACVMVLVGLAWISVLTTCNVAAQTSLPNWVRGRGLAIYLTVFFGSMTAGSFLWGTLSDLFSVPVALLAAAGTGLASLLLAVWRPLSTQELDLTPSMHWPEPAVAQDVLAGGDKGPVMVTVDYQIGQADRRAFLAKLGHLRHQRYRDGAYDWGVYEDLAKPGRFVECFFVASWLEHERQHHRVSKADAQLQAEAQAFHAGEHRPAVSHFVAPAELTGR